MKRIDSSLIEEVLQRARQSERKRAIHVLNATDERLQRMINACLHDTYVTPHRHENPGKLEIFSILRGRLSVLSSMTREMYQSPRSWTRGVL